MTNGNGRSGNTLLSGNTNDYQTYTMQQIITEALERSNVGCNNRTGSSSITANDVGGVGGSGGEQQKGQKRADGEQEDEQNEQNSQQQNKRVKI